jgi:hypothetical protein
MLVEQQRLKQLNVLLLKDQSDLEQVPRFFGFKGCSVVGAAKATLAIIQLKLIASNERTNM